MSNLLAELKKLKQQFKPKLKTRFVMTESEITDEPNVIWVLFDLKTSMK